MANPLEAPKPRKTKVGRKRGHNPDPPTQKSKGFSLPGTPKILGKKEKRTKKQGKAENKQKKGNRKKQGFEGQGSRFSGDPESRSEK